MSPSLDDTPRCGLCRALVMDGKDWRGRPWGHCHRNPRSSTVGVDDEPCDDYVVDPGRLAAVLAPPAPRPAATSVRARTIRRPAATITVPARPRLREIPLGEEGDSMDRDELKSILAEVLDEALGISDAPLHPRFRGGKVLIQPANPELQPKEVPIEVLLRKIIGIRDKLRVLEQKVNGAAGLEPDEKVQLQGYITGCYGSLTSFNFLFQDRADGFRGTGGGGD